MAATTTSSSEKNLARTRVKRRKRRPCPFCVDKIHVLDYKDVGRLRRFISDRGKIAPRRNSGVCAKHQRVLAEAVKRSRFIGFLPHCID